MSTTVAITGADGFIGSHLAETLVRSGYRVRAMVQYNSFNSWAGSIRCSPTCWPPSMSRLEMCGTETPSSA